MVPICEHNTYIIPVPFSSSPSEEKIKREPSGALQFEEGRSSTNLSSIVSND